MGGLDFDVIERSWGYLFREGMSFTLTLTGLAALGGIIFGTLLAMMRLSSHKWLQLPATGYVNLMRSIPLLLVIFWFYFLVPTSAPGSSARPPHQGRRLRLVGDHVHAVRGGVLLRDHARGHPVDRARPGVGGLCAGLDYWQSMRYIVLPQAFRNMLPILLTQTIILFQDTSLVYVLSITISSARHRRCAARRAVGRDVPVRGARLFHHELLAVVPRARRCSARSQSFVRTTES
jgi:glutamate/aspartate transport system permease protein